jgi:exonuclease VII large subunit
VATLFVELADAELNIIEEYAGSIAGAVESILQNETMRLYGLSTDIERIATSHINDGLNRLYIISNAINSRLELILATEHNHLNEIERTLKNYSIDNILKLGFAVVRRGDKALATTANSKVGDSINVELTDGILSAEIKSIIPIKQ